MKQKKNALKKKWIIAIVLLCAFLAVLLLSGRNKEKSQATDFAESIEETVLTDEFTEDENQEEQQENIEEKDTWVEKIIYQFKKPADKVEKSDVSDFGNKDQIEQSAEEKDTWIEKIIHPFKKPADKVEKSDVSDSGDKNQIEQSEQEISDKEEPEKGDDKPDSPSGDETEKEEQEIPAIKPPTVEERGKLEIQEKNDMPYEEALAANAVAAVYMLYPEFEMKGVYLTGETLISNKKDSAGVYVVFEQDGKQMIVHSAPLDDERTKNGTVDVYTIDLGYSTFDLVDSKSVDETTMKKMDLEKLNELIKQTVLVTVYEH